MRGLELFRGFELTPLTFHRGISYLKQCRGVRPRFFLPWPCSRVDAAHSLDNSRSDFRRSLEMTNRYQRSAARLQHRSRQHRFITLHTLAITACLCLLRLPCFARAPIQEKHFLSCIRQFRLVVA